MANSKTPEQKYAATQLRGMAQIFRAKAQAAAPRNHAGFLAFGEAARLCDMQALGLLNENGEPLSSAAAATEPQVSESNASL